MGCAARPAPVPRAGSVGCGLVTSPADQVTVTVTLARPDAEALLASLTLNTYTPLGIASFNLANVLRAALSEGPSS